ncbi:hypothetical protein HT102_06800 [Hoyosella sp. G463]|uniref:Protein kinase n=1 Tax=Lolliginicoccus lacisalsi TaxID=2742202 RepID=A0A927JD54_9ACTN|nr:hypothetical protein [Lolliginicoccus lacisalsi]MBD8506187.1 hypothetical protein [Lolliginicoccus lacisalsi]
MKLGNLVAAGATTLGTAAAALVIAAPASAAQTVDACPALPGQQATTASCSATSGPQGLALAITAEGGMATVNADGFAGPLAIAIGPGASVNAAGSNPGLALGIAGAQSTVQFDGNSAPVCSGTAALAGDFQTLQGCAAVNGQFIPLDIIPR